MKNFRFIGAALGLTIIVLGLGAVGASAAPDLQQGTPTPSATPTTAVTLADLGSGDVTINGLNGTTSVYFPLPTNWVLTNPATLTVNYAASPLLDNQRTSMTLVANGQTLTSIHPVGDGQDHTLSLTLPPSAFNKETSLRIQFVTRLFLGTDLDCPEANNPGQWLTIRATTGVQFDPLPDTAQPTLDKLPEVVAVQHPIGVRPQVIFVLPDNPTQVELSTAARVAARMGYSTSGTIFPFQAETSSSLNTDERNSASFVVIGTPARQPLLTEMASALPVALNGDKYVLQPGLAPDAAVVQIMNSPWQATNKVLIVSGTTDAGLDLAGKGFADHETYLGIASPSRYAVFDKLAASASTQYTGPWTTDTVTLAGLGFPDQRLEGTGVVTTNYYFRTPPGWIRDPGAKLTLHMAYSTALTTDSHITVSVNGEPAGVYAIEPGSADKVVTFSLPDAVLGTQATGGPSQYVNIVVEARSFVQIKNCEPTNESAAWVNVVASDSTLTIPHHLMLTPDLMAYPYPFAGAAAAGSTTTIILPPTPNAQVIAQALGIATTLGRYNAPSFDIQMAAYDASLETSLADSQLIALGVKDQQPLASTLLSGDDREVSLANDALNTARMGVLLEKKSPWNPQRTALVITANEEEALVNALTSIFDAAPPVGGSGSLAVVEPNQTPHVIFGEVTQAPAPGGAVVVPALSGSATPGAVTAVPLGVTPTQRSQGELPVPSGQLVAIVVTPLIIIGLIAVVWAVWTRRTH